MRTQVGIFLCVVLCIGILLLKMQVSPLLPIPLSMLKLAAILDFYFSGYFMLLERPWNTSRESGPAGYDNVKSAGKGVSKKPSKGEFYWVVVASLHQNLVQV